MLMDSGARRRKDPYALPSPLLHSVTGAGVRKQAFAKTFSVDLCDADWESVGDMLGISLRYPGTLALAAGSIGTREAGLDA